MRKGQMTLFIILGLVFIISIVILIFIRQSLIVPQATEITPDDALAQSCLVRATDISLQALTDDGAITINEGGALPVQDEEYLYLYAPTNEELEEQGMATYDDFNEIIGFPFGLVNYTGLCDVRGVNGINAFPTQRYFCDSKTYHQKSSGMAVQTQLERAITNHMHNCIAEATGVPTTEATVVGRAEVVIQEQGIVVRYSDPAIHYSPRAPLQVVWRAIQETVLREVTEDTFSLTPDLTLACKGCDIITVDDVTGDEKSEESPYNIWEYRTGEDVHARILLENRLIAIPQEFIVDSQPFTHYAMPQREEAECELPSGAPAGRSEEELTRCLDVGPFYDFDGDDLSAEFLTVPPPDTPETCSYDLRPHEDEIIEIPCLPTVRTHILEKEEGNPHSNVLRIQRGCFGQSNYVLEVRDEAGYALTLDFVSIPAASAIQVESAHDPGSLISISCGGSS